MERNTMNKNLIIDEAITELQTLQPIAPTKYQHKQIKQTDEIERLNKVIREQSLRIKGLEEILDIQQTAYKPIAYNNLSLDEKYKRKYASNYYLPIHTPEAEKYKQELRSWRKKRKEEERLNRHRRQEKAITRKQVVKRKHQERMDRIKKHELAAKKKEMKQKIISYAGKESKRPVSDILENPWIFLISNPINYRAVDYAVQKLRSKHPGTSYDCKYIKQKVYNIYSDEDITRILNDVYKENSRAFKINVTFGIIFETPLIDKEPEDAEEKSDRIVLEISEYLFEPSDHAEPVAIIVHEPSNTFHLKEPCTIKNSADMNLLINKEFGVERLIENLALKSKDTKSRLIGIYAMGVKITLLDYAIGAKVKLPDYIINSKFINSLMDVENNMCFWACLALMTGCRKDRYTKKMNELFKDNYKTMIADYPGFDYVNELDKVEQNTEFAINIVNFKGDGEIEYIRKSNYNATRTPKYINLYENHFSYITNFEKLGKIFVCTVCGYKARKPSEIEQKHTCIKPTKDIFAKII